MFFLRCDLIGEAGQICSTNRVFSQNFLFYSPRFAYKKSMNCRINGIYCHWISIRDTKEQVKRGHLFAILRLLFQKWPNIFALRTRNGIGSIEDDNELKIEIVSSATVRGHYPTIATIADSSLLSLDTIF
jgi:hypothetical protein